MFSAILDCLIQPAAHLLIYTLLSLFHQAEELRCSHICEINVCSVVNSVTLKLSTFLLVYLVNLYDHHLEPVTKSAWGNLSHLDFY